MGYYKNIAISQMEEDELLQEEIRDKRYEAMVEQADERRKQLLEEGEDFDFERDCGARP